MNDADEPMVGLRQGLMTPRTTLHAASLGCAKPDTRAYLALAEALTLEPAEILFVGDDPHADVVGPRNAGMQTVWMNRGTGEWPADLRPADHVVTDLEELVALAHGKL